MDGPLSAATGFNVGFKAGLSELPIAAFPDDERDSTLDDSANCIDSTSSL